jgi:nitrite reductase/ring-hydroxylating ferredoxin subunit
MGLLSKKGAAEWVRVAAEAELPATGDSLGVSHNGREYVLFRLEEGIFCTQGSCSHEYSPLCDGLVEGCEVYCEKHGSRFDIKTGAVLSPPADREIQTYPVRVDAQGIWILA